MKLISLTLENFRQFEERQTICFATDPMQNITLISAGNGLGKSTICNAFLWCLFGSGFHFLDESHEGVAHLPSGFWKRAREGEHHNVIVELEFEVKGVTVTMRRTCTAHVRAMCEVPHVTFSEQLNANFNFKWNSECALVALQELRDQIPHEDCISEIVKSDSLRLATLASLRRPSRGRKSRLPLFLDSPFGNMDRAASQCFAKEIPGLRHQVIVLTSPSAVPLDAMSGLSSRIGAKFEIRAGSSRESHAGERPFRALICRPE